MIVADLLQPVHTDEVLERIGGVIVGTQGRHEVGVAVDLGVGQLVVFHHAVVVGGSDGGEVIHVECGQIAVARPLGDLGIVVFHQHGGQVLGRRQHGILGQHVAAGNGDEVHSDVVLIAEVFLNPLGPVVVFHVGHARLTAVIHRDGDADVLGKGLPRGRFRGREGRDAQQHNRCQCQGKDLLHLVFLLYY